jgi:hypothetical protein
MNNIVIMDDVVNNIVIMDDMVNIGEPTNVYKPRYDTIIGSKEDTDNEIWLNNINVREMQARIEYLEKLLAKQSKLIESMWYAPGMPGYQEGKDMWDHDTK